MTPCVWQQSLRLFRQGRHDLRGHHLPPVAKEIVFLKKTTNQRPYVSCQHLLIQLPQSSTLDPLTSHLLSPPPTSPSASLSASQTPPLHGVLLETRTIESTHSYPRDPSCFLPVPHHSFSLGPRSSPHLISYLSRLVYATALLSSSARSFGLRHPQPPSD